MKNKFLPLLILIIGIVAIFMSPIIFTSPAICERLCFLETGQIGDTIGGITSPIVGLMSIILLYKTLSAQLQFNKAQSHDNTVNHLLNLMADVSARDNKFRYYFSLTENGSDKTQGETFNGVFSLFNLLRKYDSVQFETREIKPLFYELMVITNHCKTIMCVIRKHSDNEISECEKHLREISNRYFQCIAMFYDNVINDKIHVVHDLNDVYGNKSYETERERLLKDIEREHDLLKEFMHEVEIPQV